LRHGLNQLDGETIPVHLETSNPRAVAFYRRFGFKTLGIVQVGSSPAIFSMRRESPGKKQAPNG
jgi:hypothetical protein